MIQLIVGIVIAVLVVVYIYMRKLQHGDKNLPAVSEDVNLPMVSNVEPPMTSQPPTPPANPPQQNVPDEQNPQQPV